MTENWYLSALHIELQSETKKSIDKNILTKQLNSHIVALKGVSQFFELQKQYTIFILIK